MINAIGAHHDEMEMNNLISPIATGLRRDLRSPSGSPPRSGRITSSG